MSTTTGSTVPVDPSKSAKYPVTISQRLLNESQNGGSQYTAIRCKSIIFLSDSSFNKTLNPVVNHKPKLDSPSVRTRVTPSDPENTYDLTIADDDNEQNIYSYRGSQQSSESYALVFDQETQSFILDRIDSAFTFNLRSTPTLKSAKTLSTQYPQLETSAPEPESDPDDLFADGDETTGDPSNPYDYRHFLKRRRTSSPEPIESAPIIPPTRRPSRPKSKPRPRPQTRRPSTPPREEVEAEADNEDSDSGGLTIEMEPATKPRVNRFAGAFGNMSGDGPISLRSAASSLSPAARHESMSEESDEDISDDMKLPSPMSKGVPGERGMEEEQDDDGAGDLEAELEQALESQADGDGDEEGGGVAISRYVQESSSESEEE
ncbi:hypothetical protein MMC06_003211 [Schaereria dolodes]|nr:hypothetical protein [Schaereria dolodes]